MNQIIKTTPFVNIVADPDSIALYGGGASLDFSLFTDPSYGHASYGDSTYKLIPAGTVVTIDEATRTVAPFVHADADPLPAAGTLLVLAQSVSDNPYTAIGSTGKVGLITGGNLYEDQMPQADGSGNLSAAIKAGLGQRFHFQKRFATPA